MLSYLKLQFVIEINLIPFHFISLPTKATLSKYVYILIDQGIHPKRW